MKNSKNKVSILLAIMLFSPSLLIADENVSISETFCKSITENQEKISSRLKDIEEKRFRFLKTKKEDVDLILTTFGEKIDIILNEAKEDCLDDSKKLDARNNFNIKINTIKNEVQLYIEDMQVNNSEKIKLLREERKTLFEKMSKSFIKKIKTYQNGLISVFK